MIFFAKKYQEDECDQNKIWKDQGVLLRCMGIGYTPPSVSSPILKNVSLTLERQKITTIIGPNGAGKTTLLKILLGFLTPTAGKVHKKKDIKIGYMPQRLSLSALIPLTVERFLKLALTTKETTSIEDKLDQVGALKLAKSQLNTLSGGELQRVLLARALMGKPDLLILDEPDQGIDVLGQADLYALIATIKERYQCSIALVSHDLHVVMAASDTVICLNTHVCCSGSPDAVMNDPGYLNLFGPQTIHGRAALAALATYTHHHDHCHESECPHE